MGDWTDKHSLDLEQAYIRSQTSAWDQEKEVERGPVAKGVPFMPKTPDPACFQQVYDVLVTKLRRDEFKRAISAVAKIELELNRAREHHKPEEVDQPAILKSFTTLRSLDLEITAQVQDCVRREAKNLPDDCAALFADPLNQVVVPVADAI